MSHYDDDDDDDDDNNNNLCQLYLWMAKTLIIRKECFKCMSLDKN